MPTRAPLSPLVFIFRMRNMPFCTVQYRSNRVETQPSQSSDRLAGKVRWKLVMALPWRLTTGSRSGERERFGSICALWFDGHTIRAPRDLLPRRKPDIVAPGQLCNNLLHKFDLVRKSAFLIRMARNYMETFRAKERGVPSVRTMVKSVSGSRAQDVFAAVSSGTVSLIRPATSP